MGNFEKLSVLVIVVIIVMILVVALYTWTDSSDTTTTSAATSSDAMSAEEASPPPVAPKGKDGPKSADRLPGGKGLADMLFGPRTDKDKIDDWPLSQKSPAKDGEKPASPPGGEGAETPPAPPSTPGYDMYEVRSGDTLGKIAQDRLGGTSKWPEIVKMNEGLVPERLREGMKIKLPVKGAASTSSGEKAKDSAPQGSAKPGGAYSVARGETLQTIAKKVYGRMDRWPEIWVKNLNLLDDPSDIRAGMTLQLPN